jgi:hypothetical protein
VVIVLATLGGMFVLYGGIFLLGIFNAIRKPDLARIMGVEVTPGLVKVVAWFSAFLIVIGYKILSSNLHAMTSVLQ